MKLIQYLSALTIACMSCALGACALAEPDETDLDEAADVSADERSPQASPESVAQPGGGESNAVACYPNGSWCLVTCIKTGDHLNVVGSWGSLNGACAGPGETYCHSHNLGYRTHACWGHL